MQGYAAQIPHADRWAIVVYLRALQRSQNALADDVPNDQKGSLQMPPMAPQTGEAPEMSLTKTLHPDEKVKAGKIGSTLTNAGLLIAAVFLGLSIVLGWSYAGDDVAGDPHHWKRFFYAYLIGWAYIFSICVGALWLVLLHHLVRGRWATAWSSAASPRRSGPARFPLIVFIAGLGFIIPLLAGYGYETSTTRANPAAANAELQQQTLAHKLGWLEPHFFAVRFIGYGSVFSGIAAYFARKSREQDESGDPEISQTLRIASGPAMVVYSAADLRSPRS